MGCQCILSEFDVSTASENRNGKKDYPKMKKNKHEAPQK
jgi:hypothetical protein